MQLKKLLIVSVAVLSMAVTSQSAFSNESVQNNHSPTKQKVNDSISIPHRSTIARILQSYKPQTVPVGEAVYFETGSVDPTLMHHTPGTSSIIIQKYGYYRMSWTVFAGENSKFGVRVNGVDMPSYFEKVAPDTGDATYYYGLFSGFLRPNDVVTVNNLSENQASVFRNATCVYPKNRPRVCIPSLTANINLS